jgi:hypothetical protein
MPEQSISQTTAPLTLLTPNQPLVGVEDEAQLGEDNDTIDLVVIPLEEGGLKKIEDVRY